MTLLRFLLFALLCGTLAYLTPPTLAAQRPPAIESLRTSGSSVVSGEPVRLSWRLTGGAPSSVRLVSASGVLDTADIEGEALTLEPELSETYTLVAENRQGSDQRSVAVEVRGRSRLLVLNASAQNTSSPNSPPDTPSPSGGAPSSGRRGPSGGAASGSSGGSAAPQTLPEGTFGVSRQFGGPFFSDEAGAIEGPNDTRVVRAPPGSDFYAEVSYRDPDGLAQIELLIANRRPEGLAGALTHEVQPFSLVGAPRGNCKLGRLPTKVRCLYRLRVGEKAQNIDRLPGAADEFAYVLRVRVTDGAGTDINRPVRGYVVVSPRAVNNPPSKTQGTKPRR